MNPVRATLAAAVLASALAAQDPTPNPYHFADWRSDYPVALDWPKPSLAVTYDRSRRQALERVVANLKGDARREVWQMATEFFWRAPEDAAELLVAAMDRNFGQQGMADVVRNTVEAMGKMGSEQLDDALRRALEHPAPAVQQAAFASMATSGTTETVRWAQQYFFQMDGRGRQGWLRAARVRLGKDCVPIFSKWMVPETPGPIRDQILKEVQELPPKDAAIVLAKLWPDAMGEFKAICAGILHEIGRAHV